MKKILSIVLAAMMLLAALSCAFAEEFEPAGTWYLNAIEYGGASVHPSMMGVQMTIVLNEDGTAEVAMVEGAEKQTGDWTYEADVVTVTIDGFPQAFTVVDGNLTVEEPSSGICMILGKEQAVVELPELAPVRTDVTAEDFAGVWTAAEMDLMNMHYSCEEAGLGLTISIENGKASVTETLDGEERVYEVAANFADGVMTVEAAEDGTSDALPMQMREDGTVTVTQSTDDFTMTIYFEKAE